jgi:four helix bundle protein
MRNFKELEIWSLGMQIVKDVYYLAPNLPTQEKYGLVSQITRAAVSIPSNIAEGCAKSSEKEFKLYLERALGSSFELETQILIIQEFNTIELNKTKSLISKLQLEQKKLGSFISSVKSRLTQNQTPRT